MEGRGGSGRRMMMKNEDEEFQWHGGRNRCAVDRVQKERGRESKAADQNDFEEMSDDCSWHSCCR
jgi:hypothetical protein